MSEREDSTLYQFFKTLPPKTNVMRIFIRHDDYAVLGEDAFRAAALVYRTNSSLKRLNDTLSLCTLNSTMLSALLKNLLQKLGNSVEFYANNTEGRCGWKLTRKASPGDLHEIEDLMDNGLEQKPIAIAVKVKAGAGVYDIGVAFVDISSRHFGILQFIDNDLFSNLESFAIQIGAKEALTCESTALESSRIQGIFNKMGILAVERSGALFAHKHVCQDLERLTGKSSLELTAISDQTLALGAAGALIHYFSLLSQTQDYGHYELISHNLEKFMRLDSAAIRALNVMPGPRDGEKSMSLYGLLNHCKTLAGSRLLNQWLKQPLMELDDIRARHNLVEIFVANTVARKALQESAFLAVPDIAKIQRKFQREVAKLDDVVRIYQLAIRIPDIIQILESASAHVLNDYYIIPLNSAKQDLAKYVELVETTIDLKALERHEYMIRADFDNQLQQIKTRKDQVYDSITEEHRLVGLDLNMEPGKKLKLEDHHVFGWCFRLTRADASCLRSKSGYHELGTQKAGVYFCNKRLREMNEEFRALDSQYSRTQNGLAKEVIEIAATYTAVLVPLAETLAHLDVIVSFAHVCSYAPQQYVRPRMCAPGHGDYLVKNARHPCMESRDNMQFIPNDIDLKRNSSSFAIITGPNMGGKSTYIRQIAVISLLAQIGCFVPADEATVPIVDCILARVGAGDSQLKGLSTFMAEMLETAAILKTASSNSLIVIDELGRGTSTYDGFGLAWAISQHIVEKIGCFTLFATHFHELTALSKHYKTVTNLHVVANTSTDTDITLLYKVAPGISDKSFGIHVAEVVKFPDKVIRMAKRKARELEELEDAHSLKQTDIEKGITLLRDVLKQWATEAKAREPQSAVKKLKETLESEMPTIKQHPFLKQIFECL